MSFQPLNEKQLEAIEEMAAHGFSIEEIDEVVGFDPHQVQLFTTGHGEAYRCYRKGLLRSQLELRQRIFKDAKHGSSPAQALAKKILDDAEYKLANL